MLITSQVIASTPLPPLPLTPPPCKISIIRRASPHLASFLSISSAPPVDELDLKVSLRTLLEVH